MIGESGRDPAAAQAEIRCAAGIGDRPSAFGPADGQAPAKTDLRQAD
jgi:hypothetical protein